MLLALREMAMDCVGSSGSGARNSEQFLPFEFSMMQKGENCRFLLSVTRAVALDMV